MTTTTLATRDVVTSRKASGDKPTLKQHEHCRRCSRVVAMLVVADVIDGTQVSALRACRDCLEELAGEGCVVVIGGMA